MMLSYLLVPLFEPKMLAIKYSFSREKSTSLVCTAS